MTCAFSCLPSLVVVHDAPRKPKLVRTISGWLAKMDAGGPAAPIDQGVCGGGGVLATRMKYAVSVCIGVCFLCAGHDVL